jgi:TonB family protein
MLPIDIKLESTRRNETLCLTIATGLHILALIWNPIILKSDFKAIHDFVSVDIVDETPGGSPAAAETPQKKSLFNSIKDMLLTPKNDELAHLAPQIPTTKPLQPPAAAPTLKDANRKPMQMNFTPTSQSEDLAALKNPDQIQAPGPKLPNLPVGGPTLKSKSFGGIRPKDLPFQVSGPESITTGDSSNIPIAMGNSSAKAGLGYQGPTLTETSKRHIGIVPGQSGTGAPNDTMALASPGSAPIAIGTGGNGSAPTGPSTGGTLQQRSGGNGRGGWGGGRGTGIGTGIGSGVEGMPSAAQALDNQIGQGSGSKTAKRKGFDIAGPLQNRPISYKVIPEYPAWAEEQGIMGSVRLYFTVDSSGNVRSNIRVTKTTGYPALDQLGIDALKQWKFAPLGGGEEETGQWGIITFNFSLSS